MLTKDKIIKKAYELGFQDIGFTSAEPFDSQREMLVKREEDYARVNKRMDLVAGTDPKNAMENAKSVIVLLDSYYLQSLPAEMEKHFGRAYQDDDRLLREAVIKRTYLFRNYLRDNGIESKKPGNLPARLAAARAGLGTFGKNNFFYSNKVGGQSSWGNPITLVVDQEFDQGCPTVKVDCPTWCKSTCIVSCPTKALKKANVLDPRLCISNLTYNSREITPMNLREPMGLWVYGCDICQNVCPRNHAWEATKIPTNENVIARSSHFDLKKLLHMGERCFKKYIFPHMFYIPVEHLWLWKMNVSRVMGNSFNADYIPELIRAFRENDDPRLKGMIAWALGRLGGPSSKAALEEFHGTSTGLVHEEIALALETFQVIPQREI